MKALYLTFLVIFFTFSVFAREGVVDKKSQTPLVKATSSRARAKISIERRFDPPSLKGAPYSTFQRLATTSSKKERLVGAKNHTDAADCFNEAYDNTSLSATESIYLCQAANIYAVDCYLDAPLSKTDSIELCRNAHSTAPSDCFRSAYTNFPELGSIELFELCTGSQAVANPQYCVDDVWENTSLNWNQSARLCNGVQSSLETDTRIESYLENYRSTGLDYEGSMQLAVPLRGTQLSDFSSLSR